MEPEIPPSVIFEGDMIGVVLNLKFLYHDMSDEKKFSELAPRKYLNTSIFLETSFIWIEPKS
jgi:hypothetical protein